MGISPAFGVGCAAKAPVIGRPTRAVPRNARRFMSPSLLRYLPTGFVTAVSAFVALLQPA